jgi:putative flippase GtrA
MASFRNSVARHIPPGELFRYLLVGAWNTLFGYTCFFLIYWALTRTGLPYSYIAASLAANLIAITIAFLGYKWFVFRTKGNYLKEWLRCLAVYSGAMILSAAALPPLVGLIRHTTRYQVQAPYIAGAVVVIFTVISSFFGHKHISFRSSSSADSRVG